MAPGGRGGGREGACAVRTVQKEDFDTGHETSVERVKHQRHNHQRHLAGERDSLPRTQQFLPSLVS